MDAEEGSRQQALPEDPVRDRSRGRAGPCSPAWIRTLTRWWAPASQSEDLDIQHVGKPGERVPVAQVDTESPPETFPGEPLQDDGLCVMYEGSSYVMNGWPAVWPNTASTSSRKDERPRSGHRAAFPRERPPPAACIRRPFYPARLAEDEELALEPTEGKKRPRVTVLGFPAPEGTSQRLRCFWHRLCQSSEANRPSSPLGCRRSNLSGPVNINTSGKLQPDGPMTNSAELIARNDTASEEDASRTERAEKKYGPE